MAGAELELAQHGPDVGLDGARADPQPRADLLVGITAREVVQDLPLARGERLQAGLGRLRLDGLLKACRTNAASRGLKYASPAATRSIAATSSSVSIVLVT